MTDETPVNKQEKDPIVDRSLNWPLTIVSLLLVVSTGWAIYDAFVARRPWKHYEAAFVPAYKRDLQDVLELQQKKVQGIEALNEYQQRSTRSTPPRARPSKRICGPT